MVETVSMNVEEEIKELREKNKALELLVQAQADMIDKLRAELDSRDSTTSHSPPSQDGPKQRAKRKKRKRKPSGKKRGGQPGHDPHSRTMAPPEDIDETVYCAPSACSCCGKTFSSTPFRTRVHQVWEVPKPTPHITEYILQDFACECGAKTLAALPKGISKSNFGPRIHAVCASLRSDARLSVAKTREAMEELFGISMSTGAISNIDKRVSAALAEDHDTLHEHVKSAPVLHLDETTWYLAGERRVLWCAVSKDATFIFARPKRNTLTAKELAGDDFAGIAVTDRYCAYHWIDNSRRQVCWAHLRRDFVAMKIQRGMMGKCGKLLEAEARQILKRYKQVREGKEERGDFEVWARGRKEYVRSLLKQAANARLPVKHAGVARETLKYFEYLWTFAEHEGVEPTNNTAERALRHPVISRKLSFGSQSERGLRFVERLLSVRATLRQQGRSFLDFLYARLTHQHIDLLPA